MRWAVVVGHNGYHHIREPPFFKGHPADDGMVDAKNTIFIQDGRFGCIVGLIGHSDQDELAYVMDQPGRKKGALVQAGEEDPEVGCADGCDSGMLPEGGDKAVFPGIVYLHQFQQAIPVKNFPKLDHAEEKQGMTDGSHFLRPSKISGIDNLQHLCREYGIGSDDG